MTAPAIKVEIDFGGNHTDLSAVDSEFETGIGTWASTSAALASTTAQAKSGTHSMSLTALLVSQTSVATTATYPAAAGIIYFVTAWFRAAVNARSCQLQAVFRDVTNNVVGTVSGTPITDSTSAWTQATIAGAGAPAGTTSITLSAIVSTMLLSEVHYLDTVAFTHTYTDVSQWVSGRVDVKRGRSREIDQYQAGTASFTLRNEDRRFDPSNTVSPYVPGLIPRANVRISIGGVVEFTGMVDDFDVNYEKPNICTVDVTCLDAFTMLANTFLNGYTPAQQLTGARILDVLSQTSVNFPPVPAANIAVGNTTVQTSTQNNIAALDHCQAIARSENGFFFVDKTGVLTFFDRYKVGTETTQATFTDTGGSIKYQGISQKSESLLLFNRAQATRSGGVQQEADDTASQAKFLIRTLAVGQIENSTDADVLSLCQYLVGRYGAPDVRFDTIQIELQSLSAPDLATVLGLELVQLVTVSRTPGGSGTPATITKLSIIDGIGFSCDVSNSTYVMTINLGSVDTRAFLILDDAVFGVMDGTNKLSY